MQKNILGWQDATEGKRFVRRTLSGLTKTPKYEKMLMHLVYDLAAKMGIRSTI
jgi:hypothetical protein